MRKVFKLFVVCLAAVMIFSSCKKQEELNCGVPDEIPQVQENEEVSENVEEDIVFDVSSVAEEDFLMPVEDYSSEREFAPEYVVLHFTSAVVNYREEPYDMDIIRNIFVDSGLSIHYIIGRDGKVYCYIPESRCAWHAGVGTFGNDEKYTNSMNKYSIGIEIVAIGSENDMAQYLHNEEYRAIDDNLKGFTEKQYESLTVLLQDICTRNEIPYDRQHIIGHDEYNPSKSDPGELFDWERLF